MLGLMLAAACCLAAACGGGAPEESAGASSQEARLSLDEQVDAIRPQSLGQASRISGVSPADVSVLAVWLESQRRLQV